MKHKQIKCMMLVQPTRDSAFISITDTCGETHNYDLNKRQVALLNYQSAKSLSDWVAANEQAD